MSCARRGWTSTCRGRLRLLDAGHPPGSDLLEHDSSEGDEALGELVNVVLHESVHATVHLPASPTFNESLASFVADRLTLEYLELRRGPGLERAKVVRAPEEDAGSAR